MLLFTVVIPNRLVIASHVRQKVALIGDFKFGLGTRGKGSGQFNCGAAAFLVEGHGWIDVEGRCEGLRVHGRTADGEIGRIEGEFRGVLEDIEAEGDVSWAWG